MKNSKVKFHIARPRGIFAVLVLASAMGSAPGQTPRDGGECAYKEFERGDVHVGQLL
jgi:hypothetical protein